MSNPYPYYRPVQYIAPQQVSRPAVLTTIGVLSVVISSLGLLGNGMDVIIAMGSQRMAVVQRVRSMPQPLPVVQPPPPSAFAMNAVQRNAVEDAFSKLRPLTDARRKQLDTLLSENGTKIILTDDYSPDHLAALVTGVKETNESPPSDVYLLGNGRLQISDGTAVFFPNDSMGAIRAGQDASDNIPSNTSLGGTGLSDEQIASVIDRIVQLANKRPNDAQLDTIKKALQYSSQSIVRMYNSDDVSNAIEDARVDANGDLFFTANYQRITITPAGEGTMQFSANNGSSPFVAAARWMQLDGFLSGILAIFLLISGIFLLRNSPSGRLMHFLYAGMKIIIVIGILALLFTHTRPPFGLLLWVVLTVWYPILIIPLLLMKEVREFYAAPVVQ